MAPSPTGFLHIGGVRTFLYNWLFARQQDGECLLRIENTDTSREVAESVDQIERSLTWLGIDWDGAVTFQLDVMDECREAAQRLVAEGKAYEDEGAIRIRMPDDGTTGWTDAVKGPIEFPNAQLEDVVLVRGREGRDHARHPRRRPRFEHAEADQHPAGARRRDPGVRARPEPPRCRRQEALEAPRGAVDRRVP
jgi:glutamyl/glutaminyl-tRNA synthetase